jgi:hypothetical protein
MTTQSDQRHQSRVNLTPDFHRCTHITTNGRRCLDPSMTNKALCFAHENRRIRALMKPCPPSTFNQVPLVRFVYIDDIRDVLDNINAALDARARHAIDDRTLSGIQRMLETALRATRYLENAEKKVEKEEAILDARWDDNGNPYALDPETQPANLDSQPADPATNTVIPSEAQRSRGTCGCLSDCGCLSASDPTHPKPPASQPAESGEQAIPGTLSTLTAQAEETSPEGLDPIPQPLPNQIVRGREAITRLFSALTKRDKIKRLDSYTYVLEGKTMTPISSAQFRGRINRTTQLHKIYFKLPGAAM